MQGENCPTDEIGANRISQAGGSAKRADQPIGSASPERKKPAQKE